MRLLLMYENLMNTCRDMYPAKINIPTSQINAVKYEKDTPLYLYCLSGGRSKMAMGFLEQKGFQNVKNMGAIGQYRGELEK